MEMSSLRKSLLAGVAAIGVGVAGAASAQNVHVMTVAVPGGGVAQIRYTGGVPPQIAFVPAPAVVDPWMQVSSVFGLESPFAMLDRMAAEMDRRAAAMFRYADVMAARTPAGEATEAAFGAMPPGSQSYSYVSTISGSGVCTQSVHITSRGDGPPRVERHSSGNCGAVAAPSTGGPAVKQAAPVPSVQSKQPDLILTRNNGPSPYAGMVRQVASTAR
jgi:hypothetical protein